MSFSIRTQRTQPEDALCHLHSSFLCSAREQISDMIVTTFESILMQTLHDRRHLVSLTWRPTAAHTKSRLNWSPPTTMYFSICTTSYGIVTFHTRTVCTKCKQCLICMLNICQSSLVRVCDMIQMPNNVCVYEKSYHQPALSYAQCLFHKLTAKRWFMWRRLCK